jgi:hypothetical protein
VGWRDQVRAGLVNLGWQPREADQAIAAVAADLARAGGNASPDGASPDGASSVSASSVSASPDGAAGDPADVDVAVMLRAALRKLSRA